MIEDHGKQYVSLFGPPGRCEDSGEGVVKAEAPARESMFPPRACPVTWVPAVSSIIMDSVPMALNISPPSTFGVEGGLEAC